MRVRLPLSSFYSLLLKKRRKPPLPFKCQSLTFKVLRSRLLLHFQLCWKVFESLPLLLLDTNLDAKASEVHGKRSVLVRTVETRDGEVRDVHPLGGGATLNCCFCTPDALGKGLIFAFSKPLFLFQIIKESTAEHKDLP